MTNGGNPPPKQGIGYNFIIIIIVMGRISVLTWTHFECVQSELDELDKFENFLIQFFREKKPPSPSWADRLPVFWWPMCRESRAKYVICPHSRRESRLFLGVTHLRFLFGVFFAWWVMSHVSHVFFQLGLNKFINIYIVTIIFCDRPKKHVTPVTPDSPCQKAPK